MIQFSYIYDITITLHQLLGKFVTSEEHIISDAKAKMAAVGD